MKLMGFPAELFIAPKDVELPTLDLNPTGNQSVITNADAPY